MAASSRVLPLLLLLLLVAANAHADKLVYLDRHSGACDQPILESILVGVDLDCKPITTTRSGRASCDSNAIEMFDAPDCQGAPSSVALCPTEDLPESSSIRCEEVPKGEYILFHVQAGTCAAPGAASGRTYLRLGCSSANSTSSSGSIHVTVVGNDITIESFENNNECDGEPEETRHFVAGVCTEGFPEGAGSFELTTPATAVNMAVVVVYPDEVEDCDGASDYTFYAGIDGVCVPDGDESYRVTCADRTYRSYATPDCADLPTDETTSCPSSSEKSINVTCQNMEPGSFVKLIRYEGDCDKPGLTRESVHPVGCFTPERSDAASQHVSVEGQTVTLRAYMGNNVCAGAPGQVLSLEAGECHLISLGVYGKVVLTGPPPPPAATQPPPSAVGNGSNATGENATETKSPTSSAGSSIRLSLVALFMASGIVSLMVF